MKVYVTSYYYWHSLGEDIVVFVVGTCSYCTANAGGGASFKLGKKSPGLAIVNDD